MDHGIQCQADESLDVVGLLWASNGQVGLGIHNVMRLDDDVVVAAAVALLGWKNERNDEGNGRTIQARKYVDNHLDRHLERCQRCPRSDC
jgi:hypothetical protein